MSGSQNRSCCNIIYRLGLNIVMLLTLLLSMLLFAGSFLTTCYADNMETQQVLLRPDNPLWNLLELAGFGLLFCGCLYLYEKIGEKFRRGLLVFTLTFVFGLGILLILFGRTVPAADALSVYNAAAEWILGNTDIIHPTVSYLSYYPQQIGLIVNRAPNGVLNEGTKEEIEIQGLNLLGVVPQDELVYEYDCEGRPTVELPEDSPVRKAMSEIVKKLNL